jgi:hypothetical protein
MSYDLNFWKEQPGRKLDPQSTYERLSEGERVEGLEDLPIKKILDRVKTEFRQGWTQSDDESWETADEERAFQVFTTPQFFRVDCYGLSDEEMTALIDIAAEFGCPLYDPQVGKRYDES